MERQVIKSLRELFDRTDIHEMMSYYQHGDTSCLEHTVAVVYCALEIASRLSISVHKEELIRAGILHDYFLYDWHDGKAERKIHGFTHPGIALKNAEVKLNLTQRERDVIKKHMFPLTVKPPRYRESWLICMADKICALRETFSKNSYPEIKRMVNRQWIRGNRQY